MLISFISSQIPGKVNHVVFTFSHVKYAGPRGTSLYERDVNVTVNGRMAGSTYQITSVSLQPSSWDSAAKLYLFANPLSSTYWDGNLFYLVVYSRVSTLISTASSSAYGGDMKYFWLTSLFRYLAGINI